MSHLPNGLINPKAFSHPVEGLKLIETHLSWVFLTGHFAYKVKKPVCFDFVDFSSLASRHYFCSEEIRCNRKFAPELYLDVVPIVLRGDGTLGVEPEHPKQGDEIIDYAVQMLQFDSALQADLLLEQDQLSAAEMHEFGQKLAVQHAALPELPIAYDPAKAIRDNFTTLRSLGCVESIMPQLDLLEIAEKSQLAAFESLLRERQREHFVRECHGDLHLSNLARLDSGITAFDCLEFDEALRYIDVWCDVAFLFMDCCVRDRADLAYAFVDGYLVTSGDYSGLRLLPMFAAYRSVVRAKIAALRYAQSAEPEVWQKLQRHLSWPQMQETRMTGRLIISCGMSGSGKSYWASQLVATLPSLRLCSDVLRKILHGYAPLESSQSRLGQNLYREGASAQVYDTLAEYSAGLLALGENVIIDAACLKKSQREVLYKAAQSVAAPFVVLYFTAPPEVLLDRIETRQAAGNSPSEADAKVHRWQLGAFEPPDCSESVISIDTCNMTLSKLLALLSC
jgi:aminoglycoside phosphotransferase family enzyme/predicted kinase